MNAPWAQVLRGNQQVDWQCQIPLAGEESADARVWTTDWEELRRSWEEGLGNAESASVLWTLCAVWSAGSSSPHPSTLDGWRWFLREVEQLHMPTPPATSAINVLRLCLDAVMTTHAAIGLCVQGRQSRGLRPVRVWLLGAEWELESWPLFAVLSCLWSAVPLEITLAGPAVPARMDGARVLWPKPRAAAGQVESLAFKRGLYHDTCPLAKNGEPHIFVAPNAGELAGVRGAAGVGKRGDCYEEGVLSSAHDLRQETGTHVWYVHNNTSITDRPLGVPNSRCARIGLAVFEEWGPTLRAIARSKTTEVAVFTDYTRQAAEMAAARLSKELGLAPLPVDVNPFGRPFLQPQPDSRIPSIGSGFRVVWRREGCGDEDVAV